MKMKNLKFNKCKLDANAELGRFIVAKEEIKAGEVLLSEQPIVIGPYWDSKICCINCYGEVQLICRHCKLAPLCWNCDGRHLEYECKFLNKLSVPKTFLIDNFDVVTPLRFLMLLTKIQTEKNNHNENYDSHDILNMESHCDKRRDTSIWNRHSTSVVEPLKNVIDVLSQSNSNIFDEDFIQKICGILDVNTFEVRTKNFEESPVRGLYVQAALLAHDCIGNTFITMDGNKELKIMASVDIKAGDVIYNNYTAALYGTEARQEHLSKGKYFVCKCLRCTDPTELGTHLSSMKCHQCANGILIRDGDQSAWKCMKNDCLETNDNIETILRKIRLEVNAVGPFIDDIENFIAQYSSILHPNHYILIEMKQRLAALIRHMGERDEAYAKSEKLLKRKIELCKEILPLLDVLQPGISRLKGIALYEQFLPFVDLVKLFYEQKAIPPTDYLAHLREAEIIVKEAIRMLLYEPVSNPEGLLAKQAMYELKELRMEKTRMEKFIKRKK